MHIQKYEIILKFCYISACVKKSSLTMFNSISRKVVPQDSFYLSALLVASIPSVVFIFSRSLLYIFDHNPLSPKNYGTSSGFVGLRHFNTSSILSGYDSILSFDTICPTYFILSVKDAQLTFFQIQSFIFDIWVKSSQRPPNNPHLGYQGSLGLDTYIHIHVHMPIFINYIRTHFRNILYVILNMIQLIRLFSLTH